MYFYMVQSQATSSVNEDKESCTLTRLLLSVLQPMLTAVFAI